MPTGGPSSPFCRVLGATLCFSIYRGAGRPRRPRPRPRRRLCRNNIRENKFGTAM